MDRRVARTRSRLEHAMLELLAERDLADITVADLVARADVNRSTFYQHYEDRHALLADAIDTAMAQDQAALPPLPSKEEMDPPMALVQYLQHFDDNAVVYARVFGDHGSPLAVARLQARIAAIAEEALTTADDGPFEGMPLQVAAAGLAGTVTGVLGAWIAHEPRPDVQTAAEWIWRVLAEPGARAAR